MAQIGLLVYAETLRKDFPVVVVFGREANNSGTTEYVVDRYDWRLSPRSIFWNTTYGLAARCGGIADGMALKRACEALGGSPIAFANCSPVPIRNSTGAKDAIRGSVGAKAIEDHIGRVFALVDTELPRRLAGVVTSVGDDFRFAREARAKVAAEAGRRGVPYIDLPYMRQGVRSEVLTAAMGEAGMAVVRKALASVPLGSPRGVLSSPVPIGRAVKSPVASNPNQGSTRMYKELVGVSVYCDWIDGDLRGSPFMPLAAAKSPGGLAGLNGAGTAILQGDGFFLVDSTGAIVDDNSSSEARFLIATHVAQREVPGRGLFPQRFNRAVGGACGFGDEYAKKLSRAAAPPVLARAWKEWMQEAVR